MILLSLQNKLGHFYKNSAGNGGGASFVEALIKLSFDEVLHLTVGQGGTYSDGGIPGGGNGYGNHSNDPRNMVSC